MEKASKGSQETKIIKISMQSHVRTAEELQPMDLTLLPSKALDIFIWPDLSGKNFHRGLKEIPFFFSGILHSFGKMIPLIHRKSGRLICNAFVYCNQHPSFA